MRLAEEEVGRLLAEPALEEHVVGGVQRAAVAAVQLIGLLARPAGIGDAVLVHDDLEATPPGEQQQRVEIARQRRRAEIEQVEVAGVVREAACEPLKLGRPAGDAVPFRRHDVVAVEDPDAVARSRRREQARPAPAGAGIAAYARTVNRHEPRLSGRSRRAVRPSDRPAARRRALPPWLGRRR